MSKKEKQDLMLNDEKIIEVELENGQKVTGELLFVYEENGDTYVLYQLENEDLVYGAKMKEDNSLYAIDDDEWKIIEKIYQAWLEDDGEE